MSTEEFDYALPEELIAQTPLKDRASSRLLVMDRKTGELEHKHFTDILEMILGNVYHVLLNVYMLEQKFHLVIIYCKRKF